MRPRNLWYKSAVIYELDVRTFYDSNGNGWGDFEGLIHKLDYITSLGATCIWLKPFNLSPHRDGGYDITDYYSVDPRIGSMGDFVEFMEEAASRGLSVITELVADHTSIDHPWFKEASSSRDSPWHDYYIWRDEPAPAGESPERIVFSGDDTSVWTEVEEIGRYYLHRFYPHEPDLNNAHPAVREEVFQIVAFYLKIGVSGFRVDAAPYVAEKAAEAAEYEDPHDYLRDLRRFLVARRPDAVLMAEADVPPKKLDEYFGDGDEMNLLLNFLLSQYIFLALAEGDASSIHELVDIMPRPPGTGQYANFIRNHDELDLERLNEEDRRLVFEKFAPEPSMQIYGRGIRRRVTPMLDGDPDRLRLAHSLLFAMPGTPVIYYGDEIGMGEDLGLPERQSVRTPMQWSSEENGGFSSASREELYLPAIEDGPYGYHEINVMSQRARPDSMLNWMRRLISTRHEAHPVAKGDWEVFDAGDPTVLSIRYDHEGDVVFIYHNLSDTAREARYPQKGEVAFLYEILADEEYGHPDLGRSAFSINPLGFRWLQGRRHSE
ncbi:MAG: alpha-amylase family protein [Actinobacteria bacterium]|nr:alpha-amylase family protein [Actinomycetota bacterium]